MAREPIPKSVRFEVFKRDSFTCQYCGAKAPDILLELDHLKPVAAGGDSSAMNLVTACRGCNAGKGARELDDDSVLAKQRAQIEELNQRRQQLEMMLEWRDEMLLLEKLKADRVAEIINNKGEWQLSEAGRQRVEKWTKKYPFDDVLDAIDGAFGHYFDGSRESWVIAFDKVDGFARTAARQRVEPALRRLYYIRGILRNRLASMSQPKTMILLRRAVAAGIDLDHVEESCKTFNYWSQFERYIENFLSVYENAEPDK